MAEGAATLVRCPFKDVDIEIRDYDIPDDWNVENIGQIEPTVESTVQVDGFGRRYQSVKLKRRSKQISKL